MSDYQIGDPPHDRGPIVGVPQDDLTAMRVRIATLEAQLAEEIRVSNLRAEAVERWTNTSASQHQEIEELRAALAEAQDDRDAAVAAALEEAAGICDDLETKSNRPARCAKEIRALIHQSGADALERARADGMREAAGIVAPHPDHDKSDWTEYAHHASRLSNLILAAIEKGEG